MKNAHIGLYINERVKVKFLAEEVARQLEAKGANVYLLASQAQGMAKALQFLDEEAFLEKIDLLIVIGGDGTFLQAANLVAKKEIPLLGINKGRLGFLSELEASDFAVSIDNLLVGNYEIEARMMINVRIFREDRKIVEAVGLNDITINRDPMETTLLCEAYLAHEKIDAYLGDGLIVATPTGSTGYSLSVGGPLIYPGTDCFIITPIAPHSLTTRPVIVPDSSQINVILSKEAKKAYLFSDGRLVSELLGSDRVVITEAKEVTKLVHLRPHRFFETVSNKLF